MLQSLKSLAAGVGSGAVTYAASIYAFGYTNALVMPHGMPLMLWSVVVIFGLGATMVAFILHFITLRTTSATIFPAMTGFAATTLIALAATGQLAYSYIAFLAWCLGALLATFITSRLRSNNSFKPNPLRGSA